MKVVIFKSEKKAKFYEIRSIKKQGIYSEGELIYNVKTDDINQLINGKQYEIKAIEITSA